MIPFCYGRTWNGLQTCPGDGTGGVRIRSMNRDYRNYSIIDIWQEYMRIVLEIFETLADSFKDHQLTTGRKRTVRHLGGWQHQRSENERQNSKRIVAGTRKLLETKLNSRNLIKGRNPWLYRLVRYSGLILKWTKDELKQIDQRTRKDNDHA